MSPLGCESADPRSDQTRTGGKSGHPQWPDRPWRSVEREDVSSLARPRCRHPVRSVAMASHVHHLQVLREFLLVAGAGVVGTFGGAEPPPEVIHPAVQLPEAPVEEVDSRITRLMALSSRSSRPAWERQAWSPPRVITSWARTRADLRDIGAAHDSRTRAADQWARCCSTRSSICGNTGLRIRRSAAAEAGSGPRPALQFFVGLGCRIALPFSAVVGSR